MTVEINGKVAGEDRWSSMAFSYGDMVAYASRGTEVRPGDVLGSGTCGGGCLAEQRLEERRIRNALVRPIKTGFSSAGAHEAPAPRFHDRRCPRRSRATCLTAGVRETL